MGFAWQASGPHKMVTMLLVIHGDDDLRESGQTLCYISVLFVYYLYCN